MSKKRITSHAEVTLSHNIMLLSNKFVSPPSEGDNGLLGVKSNVLSPHRAAFAHAAQAALFMCIHVFAKSPLFSYPEKCCFIQTNQARLGLVALDIMSENLK